jgi:hypothetical protein
VLDELIRALLAAAVVGVAPGLFWAFCLCDPAENVLSRLVYSVALSITLVPACALLQARLFSSGVTLPIAVVSVVVVFVAGLAAYLRFGVAGAGAKGPEAAGGPLVSLPLAPGPPTLVPFAAASVVALLSLVGVFPGWRAAPLVALLVLLGGVAHLLTRLPRAEAAAERSPVGEPDRRALFSSVAHYGLLSVVLVLVLVRGYIGPVKHDWPYARGVDIYEHAVMTEMTLAQGTTESFMLYPPGLHFLMALLSRLSGLEPLEIFAVLAPLLLLLTSLSCYALARRMWGWEVGVTAALFSGVLLGGTFHHLSEARFPNLIGGQFLLVMAVAALFAVYSSPTLRAGLLLATLGSSVVLHHQVASFTLALLLFLVTVLFLPFLLARDRRRGLAILGSFALLGLLSVLYAWDTYDLGRLVIGLLGGGEETGRGGEAVGMALGTKLPYPFEHLLVTATQPVLWLGLLGALLLLVDGGRGDPPDAVADVLARSTLLFWGLLLFVGSRTNLSGFPDRFERDLGVPLAVLAALASVAIVRSWPGLRRPFALAATAVAAVAVAVLVGVQAVQNLETADAPASRPKDRPPPPAVAAAGEWLEENNTGGRIIATPYLNYVPSRGMLAMGGYTGMQSYDVPRILRARDLPPFGAKPLWEAQWVLHHPDDERTERIVEENDVRYIVFHKLYPGMPWQTFKERDDLYRTAYENERVIVFAPREG